MPDQSVEQTTRLLNRAREGDRAAGEALLPVIYGELHRLARIQMAGQRPEHTLQPTALVNEAWLKLVDTEKAGWENRTHFLCVASKAMRSVLVDHARAKQADKRRSGPRVPLEQAEVPREERLLDALSISEALERLERFDEQLGRMVELRFFGGLTNAEAAEAIGVSERTVERGWRVARAWLYREISANEDCGP